MGSTRKDIATKVLTSITGDGSELHVVIIKRNAEAEGGGDAGRVLRASQTQQQSSIAVHLVGEACIFWFHALDLDSKILQNDNRTPSSRLTLPC